MVSGGAGSVSPMAPVADPHGTAEELEESAASPISSSQPEKVSLDGQRHVKALERRMNPRHLMMISFGGVIGTGLFLSTGNTIHQAGPLGTVLAYSIGAVIVYLVMLCLGELSVAMPFHRRLSCLCPPVPGAGHGIRHCHPVLAHVDGSPGK